MADIIQLRRDVAADWTSVNPTLAIGELGFETDTGKFKVGDGATAWTSLTYYTDSLDLDDLDNVTITANASGEILKWNGSAWINNTLAEAGIAAASHTHVIANISDFTDNSTNWDTAYGWGNHASAGYQAALTNGADALTSDEVTQLANIGTSAISAAEWGYVAGSTASFTGAASDITSGTMAIARLPEATTADYRSNTADKLLSTDQTWSAMAEVTLTDAATVALDLSTGFDFTVTLAGNRTLGNPTNVKVGQKGRIRVVQDGTGSRTLAYASYYKFAGGTAPVLTTTASAEDYLFYDCVSATKIIVSAVLDVS